MIGMWLERFVIVVISLQPRLPAVLVGTCTGSPRVGIGRRSLEPSASSRCLFFLFMRLMPAISIFEMRALLPEAKVKE